MAITDSVDRDALELEHQKVPIISGCLPAGLAQADSLQFSLWLTKNTDPKRTKKTPSVCGDC